MKHAQYEATVEDLRATLHAVEAQLEEVGIVTVFTEDAAALAAVEIRRLRAENAWLRGLTLSNVLRVFFGYR